MEIRVSARGARAAASVLALGWLAAAASGGRAQAPARRFAVDSATSTVRFEGHATLGAFTATTHSMSGWAELADRARLTTGRGVVEVRAATLKTGIGLRDRHLRGELDTEHNPLITLNVERVLPGAGGAGGEAVVLEGSLTIKGAPHAVRLAASASLRGDTLVIAGSTPMRFTELGMKPPSRLLGTTRVRDEFVLGYDVRFTAVQQ